MSTAFHGKVRCLHVPLRSSLSLWLRTLGKWEAQSRKGTYLPKGHSCYVAGKGSLFLCPFHRGQEESEARWVHEFSLFSAQSPDQLCTRLVLTSNSALEGPVSVLTIPLCSVCFQKCEHTPPSCLFLYYCVHRYYHCNILYRLKIHYCIENFKGNV